MENFVGKSLVYFVGSKIYFWLKLMALELFEEHHPHLDINLFSYSHPNPILFLLNCYRNLY